MGVKRIVDTDFWKDAKVIDDYSPEDKYFWLYLLTNPQTRQLGVYKLPKKIVAFETGYSLDTVKVLLERFQNKYKAIIYSDDTQEIALLNYLRYSILKGGKPVLDCIAKDISLVKDKKLLNYIYQKVNTFDDTRETLTEIKKMLLPFYNYNDIHNDIYIYSIVPRIVPRIVPKEENPKQNSKENRFAPPTLEKVMDYCQERGNNIDAGKFVDFYQSKKLVCRQK